MTAPTALRTASPYAADAAPTRYVTVGDASIAYRALGPASPVPLVLSMRLRGTMDEWDPAFLDALSARRRVYIFDSAGVGLSSGVAPDAISAMAGIAIAFIEAMELGQVDLLGWSMGGYIATSVAFQAPALVRRLIVAGSGPGGVPGAPPPPPAKVGEIARHAVNDDEDFLYLFYPQTPAGRTAGQAQLARLGQRAEPPAPKVSPEAAKVMVDAFNSYAAVRKAPDARLKLFPAAGHGFLFQYAVEFAEDVDRFLNDAGGGASA